MKSDFLNFLDYYFRVADKIRLLLAPVCEYAVD